MGTRRSYLGGFPSFALWATVMLWAVAALTAPVRGAQVEPVQYGPCVAMRLWLVGRSRLVTESAESVRAADSREATA